MELRLFAQELATAPDIEAGGKLLQRIEVRIFEDKDAVEVVDICCLVDIEYILYTARSGTKMTIRSTSCRTGTGRDAKVK